MRDRRQERSSERENDEDFWKVVFWRRWVRPKHLVRFLWAYSNPEHKCWRDFTLQALLAKLALCLMKYTRKSDSKHRNQATLVAECQDMHPCSSHKLFLEWDMLCLLHDLLIDHEPLWVLCVLQKKQQRCWNDLFCQCIVSYDEDVEFTKPIPSNLTKFSEPAHP